MEALNKKIEQLQRDKIKIEREIDQLNQQRQTVLTDFIRTLVPMDIDPRIIIGGLIHVLDQARTQPATAEVWRQAGQKFWRQNNASKAVFRGKTLSTNAATAEQKFTTTPASPTTTAAPDNAT